MKSTTIHRARHGILPVLLVLAALLAGCGSAVDPAAFDRFAESTAELRDGADDVLGHQYEWALARFTEETAAGDEISEDNVQRLILENVPGRRFAWTSPQPPLLFLGARQFRQTVSELNDALVQYAELLAELAVAGRLDGEEFKATAEGINTGIRDAATALGEPERDKEIAIFSVAATELFQQYLNSRNRKLLRDALSANQENIRVVSEHMRDAMELAADHAFTEYGARAFDLALTLTPDSGLGTAQKKERIQELIGLNELLIDRLDTLRRLDDSYRALPAANRELAASLDESESGLAAISRIRDNAKRLRELYKELEDPAAAPAAVPEPETDEE